MKKPKIIKAFALVKREWLSIDGIYDGQIGVFQRAIYTSRREAQKALKEYAIYLDVILPVEIRILKPMRKTASKRKAKTPRA